MADKVFPDGMNIKWLGKKHPDRPENVPDFVLGKLSFNMKTFIECMQKHNSDGWLNIDIKKSKGGNIYAEVDSWKKEGNDSPPPPQDTRDFSNGDPDDPFAF